MTVMIASDSPDAWTRTLRISGAGLTGLRVLALALVLLALLLGAQAWRQGHRSAVLQRTVLEQASELAENRARLSEMAAVTEDLLAELGTVGAMVREVQEVAGLEPELELAVPEWADRVPAGGFAFGGPDDGELPVSAADVLPSGIDEVLGAAREDLDALRGTLGEVRDTVEQRIAEERATPSGWPVRGWISSYFGMRRSPISGRMLMHKGMDIVAPYGTPIAAAAPGTVVTAGWSTEGYGYHVVMDHGFGYRTLYAHMSKVEVEAGDVLEVGDTVGRLGNTGYSTGAHLHFEVWRDGTPQDPSDFLQLEADAG